MAASLITPLLGACGSAAPSPPGGGAASPAVAALQVASPDLSSGSFGPELTCDGAGRPPAIAWSGGPAATRAVAIELLDPDAPGGSFVHWLALLEAAGSGSLAPPLPSALVQGRNGDGRDGYLGPCPPRGPPHRYHLAVLALSAAPALSTGFTRDQLEAALGAQPSPVLARGELVASYVRP